MELFSQFAMETPAFRIELFNDIIRVLATQGQNKDGCVSEIRRHPDLTYGHGDGCQGFGDRCPVGQQLCQTPPDQFTHPQLPL